MIISEAKTNSLGTDASMSNYSEIVTKQSFRVPFPDVYIINLAHRVDRFAAIAALCEHSGIEYNRFEAIRDERGWVGCGSSHLGCVRIAKERNLPWVLIMEDDCSFGEDDIRAFRELLNVLWKKRGKWDRFSGGPHFGVGENDPQLAVFDINHFLFEHGGFACHFDLINASAYDSILEWNPEQHPAIDVFYRDRRGAGAGGIRSICTVPHIGRPVDSDSDITPAFGHQMSSFSNYSQGVLMNFAESAKLPNGMIEISAVHPHWNSKLLVSVEGQYIRHANGNFVGNYRISGKYLIVKWHRYNEEAFMKNDDGVFAYSGDAASLRL